MKKQLTKFALTATLGLAITLTLNACEEKGGGSTFTDPRDSKTYKTVKIGTQTWMAENLNYGAEGSCYDDEKDNCEKYGRLYDWKTAKSVCPKGWHLPSNAEWDKLLRYVDGTSGTESPYNSETAGEHLKAKDYEGTDKFGFSALIGGLYSEPDNCEEDCDSGFMNVGTDGHWWSSSESDNRSAYNREMHPYSKSVNPYGKGKANLLSVRCIQN